MTLPYLGVCCQEFIRLYLPHLDRAGYGMRWSDLPEKCYIEGSRQSTLPPRQRHKGWINITEITAVQSDSTTEEDKGELSVNG